jgi:hypothetical protein
MEYLENFGNGEAGEEENLNILESNVRPVNLEPEGEEGRREEEEGEGGRRGVRTRARVREGRRESRGLKRKRGEEDEFELEEEEEEEEEEGGWEVRTSRGARRAEEKEGTRSRAQRRREDDDGGGSNEEELFLGGQTRRRRARQLEWEEEEDWDSEEEGGGRRQPIRGFQAQLREEFELEETSSEEEEGGGRGQRVYMTRRRKEERAQERITGPMGGKTEGEERGTTTGEPEEGGREGRGELPPTRQSSRLRNKQLGRTEETEEDRRREGVVTNLVNRRMFSLGKDFLKILKFSNPPKIQSSFLSSPLLLPPSLLLSSCPPSLFPPFSLL